MPGSVLKHAVCKTARGTADIKAGKSVKVQLKYFHGLFKLEPSAADILQSCPSDFNNRCLIK